MCNLIDAYNIHLRNILRGQRGNNPNHAEPDEAQDEIVSGFHGFSSLISQFIPMSFFLILAFSGTPSSDIHTVSTTSSESRL